MPLAVGQHGYRLLDTAHASRNEAAVRRGIVEGAAGMSSSSSSSSDMQVHVITKVWYTHLGYERTVLSVQESLQELLVAEYNNNNNNNNTTEHKNNTNILDLLCKPGNM